VHVSQLRPGVVALPEGEARHIRDVLRMRAGDVIEAFDDAGAVAQAQLVTVGPRGVEVSIGDVASAPVTSIELIVASAVPKGDRADWMIEKLSELGVSRFVPLQTERSVVLPQGRNKAERWTRIATESAKQSRRAGVMRIEPLTTVDDALKVVGDSFGIVLSVDGTPVPIVESLQSAIRDPQSTIALFIGPEGGWTPQELGRFAAAGLTAARLTATILRVETAAVAAAATVAAIIDSRRAGENRPARPSRPSSS
jgi:16S rRNA (uracil1498-N3)-methyltransferase